MSAILDNLYFRVTSNLAFVSHCLSCEVNRNLFCEPVSLWVYLKAPAKHGRTAPRGLDGLCRCPIYFFSAESHWFTSPLSNISIKK